MGHRALVAYERDNGKYNVHYTHWGAHDLELQLRISETTPFGGDNDMAPPFLGKLLTAIDEGTADEVSVGGKVAEAPEDTPVEREPEATNVELSHVTNEMLDFLHHEAFYVVDTDFDCVGYQTWRLIAPEDGEPFEKDVGNGVLYRPSWYPKPDERPDDAKPRRNRQHKFRGMREAAESMIEADVLDHEAANDWLVRQAATLAEGGASGGQIPDFSPFGHPPDNYRKGGYATTPVPLEPAVGTKRIV